MMNFKSTLALALTVSAVSAFAATTFNVPSAASMEPQGNALNVHVSQTVGTAYIIGGPVSFASGTLTSQAAFTYSSEARMWITSPQHAGVSGYIQCFTGTTFTVVNVPATSPLNGTLSGTSLASGDTVDCEFYESYNDVTGGADAQWDNLAFTIPTYTPPQPPAAQDLGTIGADFQTTFTVNTPTLKWYKFTTSASTGANYFEIDTEDTTTFLGGTFANDTMLGLYDTNGNVILTDDDDGSGFRSLMTWGTTAGDRGTMTTGADGASQPHNGYDGDLPAGTYYLAVTGYPTTFAQGWAVTPTNGHTGDIVLHFRTNLGGGTGGGNSISGHCELQDLAVSSTGMVIQYELRNLFGPVASGSTALDGSGNYHVNFNPSLNGVYSFWVKGATWLGSAQSGIALGTDVTGVNFSLKNGDCDGDNEVALADFGILSDAFGSFNGDPTYAAGADLDKDDEVGLADFGILSSNFGEIGD